MDPDVGLERQEKGKRAWKTRIRCSLRLAAAFGIEADMSVAAAQSSHFVRGFEGAPMDAALVLPEFQLSITPPDLTDRLFSLWDKYRASARSVLIPIDIKSFAYHVGVLQDEFKYGTRISKYFSASIALTPTQVKDCQALIISPLGSQDWVAFVPQCYYSKIAISTSSGDVLYLGTVPVAMGRINPLPPLLAPFVMHKDHLPQAFKNLIAHVKDPQVKL